jgi:hypothetical protein
LKHDIFISKEFQNTQEFFYFLLQDH